MLFSQVTWLTAGLALSLGAVAVPIGDQHQQLVLGGESHEALLDVDQDEPLLDTLSSNRPLPPRQ